MCEFLSAVKGTTKTGKDKWYFLTYDLIHNTPRGKLLQEKYGGDDLIGHSVIREYFNLRSLQGENWEETDFSTPKNFPSILVKAIKQGDFRGFGNPMALLNASAHAEYRKQRDPLDAEYRKQRDPLDAEYQKQRDSLYAEYRKQVDPLFWNLFAVPENRNPNWI